MGRKRGSGAIAGWGWLLVAPVAGACAQTTVAQRPPERWPEPSRVVAATPETALEPDGEVLRQIEDPSTGDLWLLAARPKPPWRTGTPGACPATRATRRGRYSAGRAQPLSAGERPVIRTGDALMVEEHTAVVDARLEAVALESAAKGAHFKARLKIGRQGGARGSGLARARRLRAGERGCAMRAGMRSCFRSILLAGIVLCALLGPAAGATRQEAQMPPRQPARRRLLKKPCAPTSPRCARSRRPRCGPRARSGARRGSWCGWARTSKPSASTTW